jgi:hypothetical protein
MTNTEFEIALEKAAAENLRLGIDAAKYVEVILNEMWNGERYEDQDGDMYFEIPARDTYHGRPVVIS